jgi:uncharacterized membrane protein YedE/YeeE
MIDFIIQPWPWWFSGIIISIIMFFLIYFGESFGFSSNLRTICAALGLGKTNNYFDFNWRLKLWNIVFLIGAIIGGYIGGNLLTKGEPVKISEATIVDLAKYGFAEPTSIQPPELFSWNALFTLKGFLIMALGGLMVGFGARYAGGCTSGHAISGLSDLQWPSFIAVVGFFVGGLIMTFLIFPFIF